VSSNELEQAHAALAAERNQLEVLQEHMRDAAVILSPDGAARWMNRAALELTDCGSVEAFNPGKRIFVTPGADLIAELSAKACASKQARLLPPGTLLARSRGRCTLLSGVLAPILDGAGVVQRLVLSMTDITERTEVQRTFEWQARHDLLTGLTTRQELERRLQELLDTGALRETGYALLLIEVAHLGLINEACGHATGDALLQQFGQDLLGWARPNDVVSRVCGNQFALLLHNCGTALAQEVAAGLIGNARGNAFTWEEREFRLSLSIGIVLLEQDYSAPRLLSLAEIACGRAKERSPEPIHLYHARDEALLLRRHREIIVAADLPRLVREQRLVLYYEEIMAVRAQRETQPRFDLTLRLRGQEDTPHAPQQIITSAQRYGLVSVIDRWIIASVIDAYQNERLPLQAQTPLFHIDVAPDTLAQPSFVSFVLEQLAASDCPPGLLCLQLSDAGADIGALQQCMQTLRAAGVQFALDDFGNGALALQHLKQLPAQYVKISGAIVRGLADDDRDRALVAAICQLSHANGMRVIAEQVESPEVLTTLRQLRVDYAQGLALSAPHALQHLDVELTQRLSLPLLQYELPAHPPGMALQ
jgi:diguanylate cyclase (GGDEF)-like protein